jgi:hypothetical protein
MNREHRTLQSSSRLVAVSAEELMLVEGGSVVSKLKKAAKWVKDHIVITVGKVIGVGVGGKF